MELGADSLEAGAGIMISDLTRCDPFLNETFDNELLCDRVNRRGRFCLGYLITCMLLAQIPGCASGESQGSVRLERAGGRLLYQGAPLPFYQLLLLPEDGPAAIGLANEDGNFVLGTHRPEDGAISGTHRAAIVYVGDPELDPSQHGPVSGYVPPPPASIRIPKKYGDATISGLTVEIPVGGSDEIIIDLE